MLLFIDRKRYNTIFLFLLVYPADLIFIITLLFLERPEEKRS